MTDDFYIPEDGSAGSGITDRNYGDNESNEGRLSNLEQKVKRISVINEALYEILAAKLNVTHSELESMIEQVVANRARKAEAKSTCRDCGRLAPSNRLKCMYCGGEFLGEVDASLFDR